MHGARRTRLDRVARVPFMRPRRLLRRLAACARARPFSGNRASVDQAVGRERPMDVVLSAQSLLRRARGAVAIASVRTDCPMAAPPRRMGPAAPLALTGFNR